MLYKFIKINKSYSKLTPWLLLISISLVLLTQYGTSYKPALAGDLPKEVIIEDKTINEKLRLISELDKEDKNMVFRMTDKMLTTKKFKEFFDKNMVSL